MSISNDDAEEIIQRLRDLAYSATALQGACGTGDLQGARGTMILNLKDAVGAVAEQSEYANPPGGAGAL